MRHVQLFKWRRAPLLLLIITIAGLLFYSCSDTTSTNNTIKKEANANHFMDPGKAKRDTSDRDSTTERGGQQPPIEGDQIPPPK